MLRTVALTSACVFGLATGANATMSAGPVPTDTSAVVKVGEGCGPGRWRGPYGGCNTFTTPYGNHRGTAFECPAGFHLGPDRGRCWPNR